jgi:hypothetical protein
MVLKKSFFLLLEIPIYKMRLRVLCSFTISIKTLQDKKCDSPFSWRNNCDTSLRMTFASFVDDVRFVDRLKLSQTPWPKNLAVSVDAFSARTMICSRNQTWLDRFRQIDGLSFYWCLNVNKSWIFSIDKLSNWQIVSSVFDLQGDALSTDVSDFQHSLMNLWRKM